MANVKDKTGYMRELQIKANALPKKPGCYLMKNKDDDNEDLEDDKVSTSVSKTPEGDDPDSDPTGDQL